jgi:hypothetical protein
MKIQEKIRGESIKTARWYQKGADLAEIPVPSLGPDLIDGRKITTFIATDKVEG